MCLSPSGHFLWGGFSDGTLRVFDLTGTFGSKKKSSSSTRTTQHGTAGAGSTAGLVNSKVWQSYGAVACQIHARGVHTDLLTTVDVSPDGRFVFCGVQRGAVELYAVDASALELAVVAAKKRWMDRKLKALADGENPANVVHVEDHGNILDYLQVYCHSDAKLKGFGACTAMKMSKSAGGDNKKDMPSYFLLTGKGIKNIHIWKFTPPVGGRMTTLSGNVDDDDRNGLWEQLYDTPTNGNTINLLDFYRTSQDKLLAVSKSGNQKLRLFDLSREEKQAFHDHSRPKRPAYEDVANSQAALGIAGSLCVCGGDSMYNQLSIVSLDQPKNAYNHTELALPTGTPTLEQSNLADSGFSGRRFQRRGEMKAIVNVATMRAEDASHYALLELDDGSLVQYNAGTKGAQANDLPRLTMATPESTGIPALPAEFWSRSMCVANISGIVVAATSMYNANTNKGRIVIRALQGLNKKSGKKEPHKAAPTIQHDEKIATPKSPIAADSKALQNAVRAPPNSLPRPRVTSIERETTAVPNTSTNKYTAVKIHSSPEQQGLITPSHPTAMSSTASDETLPLISNIIEPKRINDHPQKQQGNSDAGRAASSSPPRATKEKISSAKPSKKKDRRTSLSLLSSVDSHEASLGVVSKKSKKAKKGHSAKSTMVTPTAAVVATPIPTHDGAAKDSNTNEDLNTAMVLASLNRDTKPFVTPFSKPRLDGESGIVIASPRPSNLSHHRAPSPALTPFLSRDDLILEQISVHYKQLHASLNNLSDESSSLIQERILKGPMFGRPKEDYSEQFTHLMREHKAGHMVLQRRILRAADATVRVLLDGGVTLEEARNELQETIKVYEEILYDMLQRQELERSALVAQYPLEAAAVAAKGPAAVQVEEYPCQLALQRVQDICSTIKRPVGRPKATPTLNA